MFCFLFLHAKHRLAREEFPGLIIWPSLSTTPSISGPLIVRAIVEGG